jgi:hypothetical protein
MDILDGLRRWWARRNAASTPEREPTDPSPIPKWQERLNEWMHRVHFPPIEERLDRKWQPGRPERVGLLPELADRPVRSRVKTLVDDFHVKARERELANYALHAGVVPQALGGADLSRDHRVTLKVPDRSSDRIDTRGT